MAFPADDYFDLPVSPSDVTNVMMSQTLNAWLAATKELPGAKEQTTETISGGLIIVEQSAHAVDTEASAAADDLERIFQGTSGVTLLILRPANPSRVVTVKHAAGGAGEIILDNGADYVLDKASKTLVLQKVGAQWLEVFRTGWDDAEAGGQQLFTSSGNFTVPAGITRVYVTAIGGGGGGGGGAGATGTSPSAGTDGANGSDGGSSSFGGHVVVAGGKGGGKGLGLGKGGVAYSGGHHGQNKVADYGGAGGVAPPTVLAGYGKGGAGGNGADGSNNTGGGGGASGSCSAVPAVRQKVDALTPGGTVAVTVGAGGAAGAGGTGAAANGSNGASGANGAVLIEW